MPHPAGLVHVNAGVTGNLPVHLRHYRDRAAGLDVSHPGVDGGLLGDVRAQEHQVFFGEVLGKGRDLLTFGRLE
jgi:hypothetical protein